MEEQQKPFFQRLLQRARLEGVDKYFTGEHILIQKALEMRDHKLNLPQSKLVDKVNLALVKLSPNMPLEPRGKMKIIFTEEKNKQKSKGFQARIKTSLIVGSSLPPLGQYQNITSQGLTQISPKKGQVLMLTIWSTKFDNNFSLMIKNKEMIEKNNWSRDQVRIIGITVFENIPKIKEEIQRQNCNNFQIVNFRYNKKNHLIQCFGQLQMPFCCLVDKNGFTTFIEKVNSNYQDLNMEQKINQLIYQTSRQVVQSVSNYSSQQVNGIIATVGDQKFFEEKFKQVQFISTKLLFKTKVVEGVLKKIGQITVYINERDERLYQQYKSLIPANINVKKKIVQTVKVPPVPKQCFQCKNNLNYPLYWCQWGSDPQDFRCRQCVQKKDEDSTRYIYNNNSILLMGLTQSIPSLYLGNNLQPDFSDNNLQLSAHCFECNGKQLRKCSEKKVGTPRYACLCCRGQPKYDKNFIDFCQNCVERLIKNDEELIKLLEKEGHKQSHCLLRILYNKKYQIF